jgi:hypothetical protein
LCSVAGPPLSSSHLPLPAPFPRSIIPQALFGDSLSTDGDGVLNFLDYLKAVNKRAPGKADASKGK